MPASCYEQPQAMKGINLIMGKLSHKKPLSRNKNEVLAAIKDPLRPVRAATVLQRLQHAQKHAEAGEFLITPFSNIPQSQLSRSLNDLARDKKIELIPIGGNIVIKLVPAPGPKTPTKKANGGTK